jgi:hypothetical protein
MPIPIPLLVAGLELIKTATKDSDEENEKIVEEKLSQVVDTRPFWKTKTFWSMSIGVLVPVLNKVFGWNMDVSEVTATISPLLLFIFTEQWKKKG